MKIQTYILVLIVGMFATKFAIANKILLIQDIDKECGTGEPYTPGEVDKGTTDGDNDEPDNSPKPRDCAAIYANSNWDRSETNEDLYHEGDIYPDGPGGPKISVSCLNNYISVQQRYDIDLDFDKSFEDYKNGFSGETDFWIGLEKLHQLTKDGSYRAMFGIQETYTYEWKTAHYSVFKVGPGPDYRLQASGHLEGNSPGDCLTSLSGQKFSIREGGSGGWWFPEVSELECNPNGIAYLGASDGGMFWLNDGRAIQSTYIGIQKNDQPPLKTCEDAYYWYHHTTHQFDLYPQGLEGLKVQALCYDSETLIQRHWFSSDAVSFRQDMEAYKTGFGGVSKGLNGWLGLDNIRALTTEEGSYELRLVLQMISAGLAVIDYSFSVGPAPNYELTISGYKNLDGFLDAGDCLSILNGEKFSLSAEHGGAGWWFPSGEGAKTNCNFNGDYNKDKPQGLFYFNYRIAASQIFMIKKKVSNSTNNS